MASASTPKKATNASAIRDLRGSPAADARTWTSVCWITVRAESVTINPAASPATARTASSFPATADTAQVTGCSFSTKEQQLLRNYTTILHINIFFADHDECQDTGMCTNGHCINMNGSFKCECNDGYTLSPTRNTCIGEE